jgi:2-iminoacetate synthase ThiH
MGPQQAAQLLAAGCNDMGGSIMNESITRAAGLNFCVVHVQLLLLPLHVKHGTRS